MADILRYAVCDDPDEWGDAPVYDRYIEARDEAERRGGCVIELEYSFSDSSLVDDFRPRDAPGEPDEPDAP